MRVTSARHIIAARAAMMVIADSRTAAVA